MPKPMPCAVMYSSLPLSKTPKLKAFHPQNFQTLNSYFLNPQKIPKPQTHKPKPPPLLIALFLLPRRILPGLQPSVMCLGGDQEVRGFGMRIQGIRFGKRGLGMMGLGFRVSGLGALMDPKDTFGPPCSHY